MPLLLALLLAIGFAPVTVLSHPPSTIPDTTDCATRLSPPQPEDGDWVYAVVEIPQNSIVKYEVDPETGQLIASRFMEMPVVYPGNVQELLDLVLGDGRDRGGWVDAHGRGKRGGIHHIEILEPVHLSQ